MVTKISVKRPATLLPLLSLGLLLLVYGRRVAAEAILDLAFVKFNLESTVLADDQGEPCWRVLLDRGSSRRPSVSACDLDSEAVVDLVTLSSEIDAHSSRSHYLMGHVRMAHGDLNEANLEFLRVADSSSSKTKGAIFFAGLTRELVGEHEKAIKIWRREPEIARFLLSSGLAWLTADKDLERAQRYISLGVSVDPGNCAGQYFLAVARFRIGLAEESLKGLANVERANCPDTYYLGEIHFLRGRILNSSGESDAAISEFKQSLELDPSDVKRVVALANLLAYSNTSPEKARELFMKAREIDPNEVWGYVGLCNLELVQDNYREALYRCLESVERFPDSAEAHLYLGRVYLRQGLLSRGVAQFELATTYDSDLVDAWLGLGDSHLQLGNENQALAAYQKALTLDAQNSRAQRQISELTQKAMSQP